MGQAIVYKKLKKEGKKCEAKLEMPPVTPAESISAELIGCTEDVFGSIGNSEVLETVEGEIKTIQVELAKFAVNTPTLNDDNQKRELETTLKQLRSEQKMLVKKAGLATHTTTS